VTAASLIWTWVLIGAVCTAGCAIAGVVGRRLQDAERERSRQQWQHMCEELGAENLDAGYAYEESPAAPAREAIPTEALR
jgi:hypothetical protein